MRVENAATGASIVDEVRVASTRLARTIGLLGKKRLPPGQGLLLTPCASVHTVGMQFAIDILFLDRQNHVLAVAPEVGPCRVRIGPPGTRSILELAAGVIRERGVRERDRLSLVPREEPA